MGANHTAVVKRVQPIVDVSQTLVNNGISKTPIQKAEVQYVLKMLDVCQTVVIFSVFKWMDIKPTTEFNSVFKIVVSCWGRVVMEVPGGLARTLPFCFLINTICFITKLSQVSIKFMIRWRGQSDVGVLMYDTDLIICSVYHDSI